MDEREFYKKHEHKPVAVGIRHYDNPHGIFWIYGNLLSVTAVGLIIASHGGFQRINFEDIKAFHLDKGRGGY